LPPHLPRLDTLGISVVVITVTSKPHYTGVQNTADRNEPTVNIGILDACVPCLPLPPPTSVQGCWSLGVSSAPLLPLLSHLHHFFPSFLICTTSSPPFSSVAFSHSLYSTHYTFLPLRVNLHRILNYSSLFLILLEYHCLSLFLSFF
jgi:hypothetical protein